MKITPVLFVDRIEPCLEFWVDRLGFTKTVEVPEGNRLGFVILQNGSGEVMLQSFESVKKDTGEAVSPDSKANLYVEVDDFEDILKRIRGVEVVLPVRITFYGMKEIAVLDPGGHLVCFAAHENAKNSAGT